MHVVFSSNSSQEIIEFTFTYMTVTAVTAMDSEFPFLFLRRTPSSSSAALSSEEKLC